MHATILLQPATDICISAERWQISYISIYVVHYDIAVPWD